MNWVVATECRGMVLETLFDKIGQVFSMSREAVVISEIEKYLRELLTRGVLCVARTVDVPMKRSPQYPRYLGE